jgi:hypothetical protein
VFAGAKNVSLIVNHSDSCPVIASTLDRTLHLWESTDGLLFRYRPEGAIGETVLQHARRGA